MSQKHLTNKASSYAYTHNQDERMNKEFFKKQQKRKRARSAITSILKQDHLIPTPDNIVKWEDNSKGLMLIMRDFWKNILRKRIDDNDQEAIDARNSVLTNFENFLAENELGIK